MRYALETNVREGVGLLTRRVPFTLFFAITTAANTAFICGLVAPVSWEECLMLAVASAALAGGAVFTILEMLRLGKESQ